jgi:bile acid-coenzyme A ligase
MLVPTMMNHLWLLGPEARAAADLSLLESILHVGAPCAPWLKRAWIDWLAPERVLEWLAHPGSVGRPVGGSRMRIVDKRGDELPRGSTGLIQMTCDGDIPYRYLGAESKRTEGWDTLADVGRLDDDGYLYAVDRIDDQITTGSTSFYPIEVEQQLEQHPSVRSAAVVRVPDDDLGQRVHAIIDTDGNEIDRQQIHDWLRSRVDAEKVPRE